MSVRKIIVASAFGAATAFSLASLPEPSTPQYAFGDGVESWASGTYRHARDWVSHHPAISGAIAGGVAGSTVFPGVGTIGGIIAGATVGATVGNDERGSREEQRKEKANG